MKKAIAFLLILLVTHEVLARALDHAELVERLLAPGPDALVALPFAALLYVVRFTLNFVAPFLLSLALGARLREVIRSREGTSPDPRAAPR